MFDIPKRIIVDLDKYKDKEGNLVVESDYETLIDKLAKGETKLNVSDKDFLEFKERLRNEFIKNPEHFEKYSEKERERIENFIMTAEEIREKKKKEEKMLTIPIEEEIEKDKKRVEKEMKEQKVRKRRPGRPDELEKTIENIKGEGLYRNQLAMSLNIDKLMKGFERMEKTEDKMLKVLKKEEDILKLRLKARDMEKTKVEKARKVEIPKVEAPKVEAPKIETSKIETISPEPRKIEISRVISLPINVGKAIVKTSARKITAPSTQRWLKSVSPVVSIRAQRDWRKVELGKIRSAVYAQGKLLGVKPNKEVR